MPHAPHDAGWCARCVIIPPAHTHLANNGAMRCPSTEFARGSAHSFPRCGCRARPRRFSLLRCCCAVRRRCSCRMRSTGQVPRAARAAGRAAPPRPAPAGLHLDLRAASPHRTGIGRVPIFANLRRCKRKHPASATRSQGAQDAEVFRLASRGVAPPARQRSIDQAIAATGCVPAASASSSALSVASHENSGSSRPKWPYAAVFS